MEKFIYSAELWFYPVTSESELLKVYRNDANGKTFITSRYSNISRYNDGWINIDVTSVVKNWLNGNEGLLNSIKISCKTCKDKEIPFIGTTGALKPFLSINTAKPKSNPKSGIENFFKSSSFKSNNFKSSPVNACRKQSTHCCVEEFYINFKEIGWSDWIISPQGYTANYCRGTCFGMDSFGYRLKILQKLSEEDNSLIPCCSPGKMSSLTIIYQDSNGYLHSVILPNMRVEQCQCF
ncbi:uncharacterized protein TRIADDRAFT_57877 [Trichoplax adhaerens]|uniref:TGF-beta family profile domain-containing protein n=1 Tax=Trichoplax adhaerens TaxID=10228 RepID=B3S1T4_TRIAD|nr:hypothetical protein TRIADDRAFT_57877 [Trichoplax adhaerens]EDV23031.1 hypothetical protein TRIADDRAFT_57877 [Trichoplax adhaerens]|eukprot:XP_002113941.1 hypothetical protein TRIADDRAFT_57877 [Trichoplax adhaerens]